MDLKTIVDGLLGNIGIDSIEFTDIKAKVAQALQDNQLKVIDLVQELNSILLNPSHQIRLRGVELLCSSITTLDKSKLNRKEIEVLSEFLCLRLIDHKMMELPTLRCLSFFVDCDNKQATYDKTLLDFLCTKANFDRMDTSSKYSVYKILEKVVTQRPKADMTLDSDLVYSMVHLFESESNPKNLMLCFNIVLFILKNYQFIQPYIDDIFEWLSCYYPIDYSPKIDDSSGESNIQKSDLVDALYDCLFATSLNSDNLQTLFLEKLESNVISTKLESLECLIKCYEKFPCQSIKNYATTLWTCVRMELLKNTDTIDPALKETCLRALSSMTRKLSEDREFYLNFISDVYEELAIAFRKPDMDLLEPAACLVTHAILPLISGFNYVLLKILPLGIRSICDNELRPIKGLAYCLGKLSESRKDTVIDGEVIVQLNKLLGCLSDISCEHEGALNLTTTIVDLKLDLDQSILDSLVDRMVSHINNPALDIVGCLSKICLNYRRYRIISESCPQSMDLRSMMVILDMLSDQNARIPVYLRVVLYLVDEVNPSDLDELGELDVFLAKLRSLVLDLSHRDAINAIARIHAMIISKKRDELEQLLLPIFSSSYCQGFLSSQDSNLISQVYLPLIQWIMKALIVRNHKFAEPLINLILNYLSIKPQPLELAIEVAKSFPFILSDDYDERYVTFSLYKQKTYVQTAKQIRLRYEKSSDNDEKALLLTSLILQIPKLSQSVYRKDLEWLLRETIRILSNLKDGLSEEVPPETKLITLLYENLIQLVRNDTSGNLYGLANSLIDLSLSYLSSKKMVVRRHVLACLELITTSTNHAELLPLRQMIVDDLRPCLSDKKRLVRQAAAQARLRWIQLGQPFH